MCIGIHVCVERVGNDRVGTDRGESNDECVSAVTNQPALANALRTC